MFGFSEEELFIQRLEYQGLHPDNHTCQALQAVEDIVIGKAWEFRIKGMTPEEVAQELRVHLFVKFDRYDPAKAAIRTWANRVVRNKLRDMSRYRNDLLDHVNRSDFEDHLSVMGLDDFEDAYIMLND